MSENLEWALTFTRPNEGGRLVGRYKSRDDAMLAGEAHFAKQLNLSDPDESDGLGWQMGFNGATALSDIGIYRVARK